MKTISGILFLALAASLCWTGCSRKTKVTQEYMDSLRSTYTLLSRDVDESWNKMIREDDQKIDNLKKLMQEVSKVKKYDQQHFHTLSNRIDSLPAERYDQKTMANSNLIDQYDSLTIQLIRDIMNFAGSQTRWDDHSAGRRLMDQINALDSNVLYQRINYDRNAKDLNAFIKINHEVLLKINPKGDYAARPLFEISPNP